MYACICVYTHRDNIYSQQIDSKQLHNFQALLNKLVLIFYSNRGILNHSLGRNKRETLSRIQEQELYKIVSTKVFTYVHSFLSDIILSKEHYIMSRR